MTYSLSRAPCFSFNCQSVSFLVWLSDWTSQITELFDNSWKVPNIAFKAMISNFWQKFDRWCRTANLIEIWFWGIECPQNHRNIGKNAEWWPNSPRLNLVFYMFCEIRISISIPKIRQFPATSRNLWPNVRYAETLPERMRDI